MHTPCEGENEQSHVTHPTQVDKVGHVHREENDPLSERLHDPPICGGELGGCGGEGEEVTLLVISTAVARISPHLTGS